MSDYYKKGEVECIDAIRAALTPNEYQGFLKGNIMKYVWREREKGGSDDLKKASDYLEWAITAVENAERETE